MHLLKSDGEESDNSDSSSVETTARSVEGKKKKQERLQSTNSPKTRPGIGHNRRNTLPRRPRNTIQTASRIGPRRPDVWHLEPEERQKELEFPGVLVASPRPYITVLASFAEIIKDPSDISSMSGWADVADIIQHPLDDSLMSAWTDVGLSKTFKTNIVPQITATTLENHFWTLLYTLANEELFEGHGYRPKTHGLTIEIKMMNCVKGEEFIEFTDEQDLERMCRTANSRNVRCKVELERFAPSLGDERNHFDVTDWSSLSTQGDAVTWLCDNSKWSFDIAESSSNTWK